jgi:ABC-2 type transport system ATP-binding protein
VIIGLDGAGKTTTLQMLLGILTPTSGAIEYFGKDMVEHRSEVLQKISFASTYVSLPYNLTLEQNLLVIGRLFGMKKKEILKNMDEYLERLGIGHKKKSLVTTLSAGQTTRMMLAKALMTKPKILLLDEPTRGLDYRAQDELIRILKEVAAEGVCVVLATHDVELVADLATRIVVIAEGEIISDGSTREVLTSSPAFAPQINKVFAGQNWLTVADLIDAEIERDK